MGEAQGTGDKESSGAFGRIVEYLKHHPPLLFGLGAGMLLLASAKQDYRPVTVPLVILFVLVMVVWLAAERIKHGTFSFRQGRSSTIEGSTIGGGHSPGSRDFDVEGRITNSRIGNVGPPDSA